jgi:hypothetical protein
MFPAVDYILAVDGLKIASYFLMNRGSSASVNRSSSAKGVIATALTVICGRRARTSRIKTRGRRLSPSRRIPIQQEREATGLYDPTAVKKNGQELALEQVVERAEDVEQTNAIEESMRDGNDGVVEDEKEAPSKQIRIRQEMEATQLYDPTLDEKNGPGPALERVAERPEDVEPSNPIEESIGDGYHGMVDDDDEASSKRIRIRRQRAATQLYDPTLDEKNGERAGLESVVERAGGVELTNPTKESMRDRHDETVGDEEEALSKRIRLPKEREATELYDTTSDEKNGRGPAIVRLVERAEDVEPANAMEGSMGDENDGMVKDEEEAEMNDEEGVDDVSYASQPGLDRAGALVCFIRVRGGRASLVYLDRSEPAVPPPRPRALFRGPKGVFSIGPRAYVPQRSSPLKNEVIFSDAPISEFSSEWRELMAAQFGDDEDE